MNSVRISTTLVRTFNELCTDLQRNLVQTSKEIQKFYFSAGNISNIIIVISGQEPKICSQQKSRDNDSDENEPVCLSCRLFHLFSWLSIKIFLLPSWLTKGELTDDDKVSKLLNVRVTHFQHLFPYIYH